MAIFKCNCCELSYGCASGCDWICVRKWGGEMVRALCIEVYRSPWWLLVFVVAGLAGVATVHVILQGGLESSQLLPFYIGWTLGVIIVWSVIRKISTVSK